MRSLINSVILLSICCLSFQMLSAQENVPSQVADFEAYEARYPYISYHHGARVIETEFEWPEGYQRVDSSKMSPWQYWVSYLPLWGKTRAVGSYVFGRLYKPDEIARPINLPWRTSKFVYYAIPMQLKAEYLLALDRIDEFSIKPKKGVDLTIDKWLGGKMVFNARDSLFFQPSEKREYTEKEFNRFFHVVVQQTSFASLAANCDSIAGEDLLPGDMYIAHDENGLKGEVYIVLCVVENEAGEKLYVVATGCDSACDFYIPLFNDRKEYPWITLETLQGLIGEDFPNRGFFRLTDQ